MNACGSKIIVACDCEGMPTQNDYREVIRCNQTSPDEVVRSLTCTNQNTCHQESAR